MALALVRPTGQEEQLDALVSQAAAAHQAVRLSTTTQALDHAKKAGDVLREAQRDLDHGAWLPWLKRTGIPIRTAQVYSRISEHWTEIQEKRSGAAYFSIREALAAISKKPAKAASPKLTLSFRTERQKQEVVHRLDCLKQAAAGATAADVVAMIATDAHQRWLTDRGVRLTAETREQPFWEADPKALDSAVVTVDLQMLSEHLQLYVGRMAPEQLAEHRELLACLRNGLDRVIGSVSRED